jgi:hypothetical protein
VIGRALALGDERIRASARHHERCRLATITEHEVRGSGSQSFMKARTLRHVGRGIRERPA